MEIIKGYIIWIFSFFGLVTGLASCADKIAEMTEPEPVDETNIICIGGMETESLTIDADNNAMTRASEGQRQDAEDVDWLLDPLFKGLDITYRLNGTDTRKVAILQLKKSNPEGGNIKTNIKKSAGGFAEYSFMYRDNLEKTAQWFGNGYHYFEGVYVPDEIRYDEGQNAATQNTSLDAITNDETGSAPGLYYDQSKDQSDMAAGYANYTLLERYLAMPANWGHNATVERIKLPFKHRLARVIAYVLIDPVLVDPVTGPVKIKGYNYSDDGNGHITREDATSSAIRFSNVKVLNGVEEKIDDTGHATLTPKWTAARKAIPHFLDERGSVNATGVVLDADNFIMYYKVDEKKYIFPANDESDTKKPWTTAHNKWNDKYNAASGTDAERIKYADEQSGYVRTKYGKVPVYDIIVRPTYTSSTTVMYDEDLTGTDKDALANETNIIYFDITLANELHYEKKFEFDLDANEQTIVYLRIKPESVDYNSSGAEVWTEEGGKDGFYGVNNQNENTLSFAGNSWQRAYRIGTKHDNVTDGHFYDKDSEDEFAQYVDDATWIKMFSEAYEGGAHHGDYFILEQDLTISAKSLPDDFVFTGHLDGQGHTITLTDPGASWEQWFDATLDDYDNSKTTLYTSQDKSNAFVMPTPLFTHVHHDAVMYDESELTEVDGVKYVTTSLTHVPASDAVLYENAEEYNLDKNLTGEDALSNEAFENLSEEEKIKTPAVEDHYEKSDDSILGTTPKIAAYDEYPSASPTRRELLTAADGTYFTRSGEEGAYTYSPFNKPQHLYTEIDRHSGSSLFGGLNAKYTTRQENGQSPWEANVHQEGSKWVPVAGYRAELLNVKLAEGGKFFPEGAVFTGNDLNKVGATVTGYIFNCWEGSDKVENIVPIPQY